jgi:hypothetical protein
VAVQRHPAVPGLEAAVTHAWAANGDRISRCVHVTPSLFGRMHVLVPLYVRVTDSLMYVRLLGQGLCGHECT